MLWGDNYMHFFLFPYSRLPGNMADDYIEKIKFWEGHYEEESF